MAEKRDFDEFLEKFQKHHQVMVEELHKVIVGQDDVIDQILAAIFTGGHCLLWAFRDWRRHLLSARSRNCWTSTFAAFSLLLT